MTKTWRHIITLLFYYYSTIILLLQRLNTINVLFFHVENGNNKSKRARRSPQGQQSDNAPKAPGCWRRIPVAMPARPVNDNDWVLQGSACVVPWDPGKRRRRCGTTGGVGGYGGAVSSTGTGSLNSSSETTAKQCQCIQCIIMLK